LLYLINTLTFALEACNVRGSWGAGIATLFKELVCG
jgi:hypothetical protein